MLAEWANVLVNLVAGFAVGVLGVVFNLVTPQAYRNAAADWRPGEDLFAGMRRRAEAQSEIMEVGPRSFRIAGYSFVATIAVIVLTVWLSPVSMEWWPFLGALAVGAAAAYGTFQIARRKPPTEAPVGETSTATAGAEEATT